MRGALTRRDFLAGCAAGAAALWTSPATARRHRDELPAFVMFDRRIPVSIEFARRHRAAGVPCVDIATQDAMLWRTVRRDLAIGHGQRVDGVCRWSDWVNLRGEFAAAKLRVRHERRLPDGSFAWTMA